MVKINPFCYKNKSKFRANRNTSWYVWKENNHADEYFNDENKFMKWGYRPEDHLHMKMVRKFWTGVKINLE